MTIKELEERVTSLTEQMGVLVSSMNQFLQDRQLPHETNVDALKKSLVIHLLNLNTINACLLLKLIE